MTRTSKAHTGCKETRQRQCKIFLNCIFLLYHWFQNDCFSPPCVDIIEKSQKDIFGEEKSNLSFWLFWGKKRRFRGPLFDVFSLAYDSFSPKLSEKNMTKICMVLFDSYSIRARGFKMEDRRVFFLLSSSPRAPPVCAPLAELLAGYSLSIKADSKRIMKKNE
jgi:hypothetical protein